MLIKSVKMSNVFLSAESLKEPTMIVTRQHKKRPPNKALQNYTVPGWPPEKSRKTKLYINHDELDSASLPKRLYEKEDGENVSIFYRSSLNDSLSRIKQS